MPDYRGIRTTEGKFRVLSNIKSPLSANENPLQAEMLHPTVRNSEKFNGEDWAKFGPKIIRTIPGSGLPGSGLPRNLSIYLQQNATTNVKFTKKDAVTYKRTLIKAKSHWSDRTL